MKPFLAKETVSRLRRPNHSRFRRRPGGWLVRPGSGPLELCRQAEEHVLAPAGADNLHPDGQPRFAPTERNRCGRPTGDVGEWRERHEHPGPDQVLPGILGLHHPPDLDRREGQGSERRRHPPRPTSRGQPTHALHGARIAFTYVVARRRLGGLREHPVDRSRSSRCRCRCDARLDVATTLM